MKRVLLLNGPSQDSCDRFFGWPTPILYAVAPSYSAATMGRLDIEFEKEIFDPVWYDEPSNGQFLNQAMRSAADRVDVICASVTYDSLWPTLQLLETAKQQNPELLVIVGGPHIDEAHRLSFERVELLQRTCVDYWVSGDGEFALLEILKAFAKGSLDSLDLSDIEGRGIVECQEKRLFFDRPIDLNGLPAMPLEVADSARHQFDFDVFVQNGRILPTTQMIAARGCKYDCTFCSERRNLTGFGARSVDNILSEIYLRKEQGYRAVFFDDSTFGLYPNLMDLLRELSATGLVFGCLNRFNHLQSDSILAAYKNAGFEYIYCAVEQFDDDALRTIRKRQSAETISVSMRRLLDCGFKIGVSLLYGLRGESSSQILTTLDFIADWVDRGLVGLVSESVLSFHPGTPDGRGQLLPYDTMPPNPGFPFDRFEEGQWYHNQHVTPKYLEWILRESEKRFSEVMIRNRHSWYAEQGLVRRIRHFREIVERSSSSQIELGDVAPASGVPASGPAIGTWHP